MPLFVTLRSFPNEQLVKLLLGEISNGTAHSRQFVVAWLLYPNAVRQYDSSATQKYAQALAEQALPIGQATLKAVTSPKCDEADRRAMLVVLSALTTSLQIDWKKKGAMNLDNVDPKWREFIDKAFDSDMPLRQGFAAVAMVKLNPDRSNLAKDLAGLFASQNVMPLLRCNALYALEQMLPFQVQPVASSLLRLASSRVYRKNCLTKQRVRLVPIRHFLRAGRMTAT